ncbi:hypothetical protein LZ198_15145 [Myxococcus sp. K15C18031901]|uniref:hypothetical protein n=1 Tax=Myxococcus dinghuensis TaxID=2906761 RepID=UPI0020A7147F|nr:hypothetical protein [Myxococcus dinghuensis]MCP3100207.1 hypothetical protein [Myxococcus dinghuensis]
MGTPGRSKPLSRASGLPWWPLLLIAVAAWGLRVAGFLHRHGALGPPVDYDEGVYFSAAALLSHGLLPYRDYFFAHPPGIALLWAPLAALARGVDVATAFAVVRWCVPVLGALSAALSGRIAQERWGTRAGVVAALAYALYPEALNAERGIFLEPWLNLVCLSFAWVWLRPSEGIAARRRDIAAGALLATACALKLTAGVWVVAAVVACGVVGAWRRVARTVGTAGVVGLVIVGPFLALAPGPVVDGLLRFQLLRPPDGELSASRRMVSMLAEGHAGVAALGLLGLVVALVRWRRDEALAERLFGAAWLLTVATFLSARSYWVHYNASLAPTTALLAGLGASVVRSWASARPRWVGWGATALVGLAVLATLPDALRQGRTEAPWLVEMGRAVRASVPETAALCAFEPAWGIAGGRLPGVPVGTPALVDPYGLMLHDALGATERFATATAAFEHEGTQRTIRPLLERCDALVLQWRGEWQLSDTSEHWVREHFTQEGPLWRRTLGSEVRHSPP